MSKDIWHTADEIPKTHKDVVEKWKNCYDEICYSMWKQRPDGGSFDSHTIGWAYLLDLLALETELERTRKALDRAKWWLHEIVENHRYTPISTAEMALKDIVALEQKD